jgi:alkanesulfonate monooxygenase SsuD/methylene tetrahydromethanopterin reductase-like flavin-dependent oxidoreductase (luciferase family)
MVGTMIATDEAGLARRRDAMLETFGVRGEDPDAWLAARRQRWIVGTPDEARAMVRRYADAGVERLMLQDFLPWDLEMVELMGRELIGKV